MKITYLTVLAGVIALSAAVANAKGRKNFGDGGALPDFLQEYDVNEDGMIDEEERQAAKAARQAAREARRAEVDTNNDGTISDEERAAAREARVAAIEAARAERFAAIAGEDGVLSATEFAAIPALEGKDAERVSALFARLDADDNNEVSLEEFNARLRDHRGKKNGRRGGKSSRDRNRGGGDDAPDAPETPEGDTEDPSLN